MGRMIIEKICPICKSVFHPWASKQVYCSKKCPPIWNKGLPAPWARNNPQVFKKGQISWWKGKKLTYKIWNVGKKGLQISWNKGNIGYRKGVSKSEEHKRKIGIANGSKKGWVTSINMRIRGTTAYSNWRKAVFERDNYTCQMCGVRGGYLEADHIKPFALFPELRFELSNGRTLCKPCHKTTDTYMGKTRWKYKQTLAPVKSG